MRRFTLIFTCATSLAGCASIGSSPATDASDGLVYFLPNKHVLVTVIKKKQTGSTALTTTVSITSSAAFPDLSQAYVARFNQNLVGKNALKVGISPTGLLSSSKSTTTSGLTDALKNLAESVAMSAGPGLSALPTPAPACSEGTHTFMYSVEPGDKGHACDLRIAIERVSPAAASDANRPATAAIATPAQRSRSGSGLFYRQEEAFKVTARGLGLHASAIVLSPSLSPTRFLPVASSLFSSNEADFGFVDGMPTKYNQEVDGELVALFKLPAEVVGAYFGAVGKLFDNFKARDSKEAELLAAATRSELAKKKYDACLDAISKKDDTLIAQLDCGK